MNYFRHLIESKGAINLIGRMFMLVERFGMTHRRSIQAMRRIVEVSGRYGCKPSFFITADLLDHHKCLVDLISTHEIDLCLHGYHHIDHALLSRRDQTEEISRGVEEFRRLGMRIGGFRAPFLRFNDDTPKAVVDSDLLWVSNTCMLSREESCSSLVNGSDSARNLLEGFYTGKRHSEEPSIPFLRYGCVDIPVSLPDDEMLIDRIKIQDSARLAHIWLDMLDGAHRDGELFNFIFHPERVPYVSEPLEKLLQKARSHGDVWIASLDDIGKWWKKRAAFEFRSIVGNCGKYTVETNITDDHCLVLQHPDGRMEFPEHNGNGTFVVEAPLRPVIGVSQDCGPETLLCLKKEGFPVESCADPHMVASVLNGCHPRDLSHRGLLDVVGQANGPVLRFWRWPGRYRSALAISVDVDAITLFDFVRRVYWFLKYR